MEEDFYIVKKNDNLYDIANNFNTSVELLKTLNNLESNIIQVDQILKLPTNEVENTTPGDYIIHSIKKGDNLYSIAKQYNITLDELINFNNQGTTLLTIGEELLIPVKTNIEDITYVVKPGDTLFNLAKRYNISVDDLKNKNNFESNLLKIGETIIIPKTKNYQTYVVKTNDTIESIANNFNTAINDIKRINNLLTDDISIGQIIFIPK